MNKIKNMNNSIFSNYHNHNQFLEVKNQRQSSIPTNVNIFHIKCQVNQDLIYNQTIRGINADNKIKSSQEKNIQVVERLLNLKNYNDFELIKRKENLDHQNNYRQVLDNQVRLIIINLFKIIKYLSIIILMI